MRFLLGIIFSCLLSGTCLADMVSVATNSAILRSHPSVSASYVLLQVPLYYPFDILEESKEFYKVSDFLNRTGWIHKNDVTHTRSVIVKSSSINVRKGPGTDHAVICTAKRGVTFKILAEKTNWLHVLHESGKKGWVYKKIVWGL